MRLITDTLHFLTRLCLVLLARLAVVLFCIAEVVVIVVLWVLAFIHWQYHDRPSALLWPVAATAAVCVQYALWQYAWLRVARCGGRSRALAEVFASVVRYPVVRTPHPWE
jgi:hypothetical protein